MKLKIILLLFLCIQFIACEDRSGNGSGEGEGVYSFRIEYPGLVDEVDGEPVQTRAALPANLAGYLFRDGTCTEVLTKNDLEYVAGTGKIRFRTEGPEVQTLYVVASTGTPEVPGVTPGMSEADFLQLKTASTAILTGKTVLDPAGSLLDRSIRLENVHAEIRLNRAASFEIERVEIYNACSQSYYFTHVPFEGAPETATRVYSASDIPVGNLDISLPVIFESKDVKITVYGIVYGKKVSLDFNLQQLRRNTRYELKLDPPAIDPTNRKFMVMAVCGESNAVGYDESPYDLSGEEAPVPHIYQLGMRTSRDRDYRNNLKVLPMDFCPQDMYDMRSRFGGTKKPHFPLGKELLKRIPAGYEVLIIDVTRPSSCITFEGCRVQFSGSFVTADHNYGLGFYDNEHMLPANLNAIYYWNKDGAFYKMLVDRLKYALGLNPENKFLGVMWIQGEDDEGPSWVQKHPVEFGKLTNAFFEDMNGAGFGERCPRGTAGKHIWYNVTTTRYWLRFHLNAIVDWKVWGYGSGQGVFGGYKLWNPDTFVRPPSPAELTNETNGTGLTAEVKASHYGNGAFSKVVCPMLVECMDENGGLFNGKSPRNDRYANKITTEELYQSGGNVNDEDVQDGLLVALPFDTSGEVTKNLAKDKTGVNITNNGLGVSSSVFTLPANSGTRSRSTLKMVRTNGKNIKISFSGKDASRGWSASCLVRRTANQGEGQQMIFGNGQNGKGPYLAYRITSTNEKCGSYTEFLASPAMVNKRETTLPGSLHNADRVRSYDEWIHYGVTYDVSSKTMCIFMNGLEVEKYSFDNEYLVPPILNGSFYLGSMDGSNLGMTGEVADFFFWNKPVTDRVMNKVYIRSYWGYEN